MRIVSQNTAKRLKSFGIPLVKQLVDHGPDVIALQEITEAQADGWSELLGRVGVSGLSAPHPTIPYARGWRPRFRRRPALRHLGRAAGGVVPHRACRTWRN